MVDAVVTWVDGEDPRHIEKRKQYEKSTEVKWTHPRADHITRFASRDEIRYCIYSIRKFASYIDKVYLVTDRQCPDWLTKDLENSLNVEVVDHSVIFQGYEKYLPTFNSLTIETMLYRIPGLSDNFLYFNDDIILTNPTREKDYFDQGHPVYRGEWVWKRKLKEKAARYLNQKNALNNKWLGKGFLGYGNEEVYFKKNKRLLFRLVHAPYPLNKDLMAQIFSTKEELENQIRFRFKNKKQYIPASLVANLALIQRKAKKGPRDYGYLASSDLSENLIEKWLEELYANKKVKSVCIQSLDQASPAVEERIKTFLHERLKI